LENGLDGSFSAQEAEREVPSRTGCLFDRVACLLCCTCGSRDLKDRRSSAKDGDIKRCD